MPQDYEDIIYPKLTLFEKGLYVATQYAPVRRILSKFILYTESKPSGFLRCIGWESERDPSAARKTCLYPMVIDEAHTAMILKACKLHGVTVHCALKTAIACALSSMILEAAHKKGIDESGLDGRVFTPASLDSKREHASFVSCQVFLLPQDVNVVEHGRNPNFWKLAADVKANIVTSQDYHKRRWLLGVGALKGSYVKLLADGELRLATLAGLSNMGNCNFINRGASTAVKVMANFSTAGEHNSCQPMNNTVVTFNKKIFWSINYFPNATTREFAVEFGHRARDIVIEHSKRATSDTSAQATLANNKQSDHQAVRSYPISPGIGDFNGL